MDGSGWFSVCQTAYCIGASMEGLNQSYTWLVQKHGVWQTFSLPASECTSKSAAFQAKVHIMSPEGTDKYIREAKAMIIDANEAKDVRKAFGWNDDRSSFLLADTLYNTGGGTTKTNALGVTANGVVPFLEPTGTLAAWTAAVNKVISSREAAAPAFMVMLSAGAPLHSLMTDEGGTTIVLRTYKSGLGKSTALAAAMSIWGKWRDLSLWSGNTAISNTGKWETMGNLPIPWDESQFAKDEDLKSKILTFSDGQPRARTGRDGMPRSVGSAWSTFLLCTSNSDFRSRLAHMSGATEGPLARLFQFETTLDKEVAQADGGELLAQFSKHYGHVGPLLARILTTDAAGIEHLEGTLLRANQERMKRLQLPNSARFACRAITCAEFGGNILCNIVKDLQLDVKWVVEHMEDVLVRMVRADIETAKSQDLVLAYIRSKLGEIIAVGTGMPQAPLRCVSGRFEKDNHGGKLYIPMNEWSKWVASYSKSDMEAEREAISLGHTIRRETIDLGKGTSYGSLGKTRCVVISLDPVAAADATEEVSKVVPIGKPRR